MRVRGKSPLTAFQARPDAGRVSENQTSEKAVAALTDPGGLGEGQRPPTDAEIDGALSVGSGRRFVGFCHCDRTSGCVSMPRHFFWGGGGGGGGGDLQRSVGKAGRWQCRVAQAIGT